MTDRMFEWLADREQRKNPEYAGNIDDPPLRGWESVLLRHWSKWLTTGWYRYLFGNPGDRWRRPEDMPWLNLWSPITDTYELRHWFKERRWRWTWLTEETRIQRILCRLRGHPNGMVFYNPTGYEPDTSCKDCGEEIG